MKRKRIKKKFIICLGISMLIMPFTNYCYATNNPDEEYTISYNLETKETTYYGYDSTKHEFYQVEKPISSGQSNVISDGTEDIAYINYDDSVEEWANPGTIYIDKTPIKEDPESPYTIIFADDGSPIVYRYDEKQQNPWSLINAYNLIMLEGTVKRVEKTSLTFVDSANRELKIEIKEDEIWQAGDKINVIGLLEENMEESKLTKQFGYFKIEEEIGEDGKEDE
ncbi:MAG: hypothetical protein Q4C91_13585 [Eubacteriales bacterium]|nr:hypothetical protein [Eubacteriales bacterium]